VARVVYQDIDVAEGRSRPFEHRRDRRKIGHVALRRNRLDAQLFHFGGNGFSALEAEIVDDYAAGIVLCEAKRDRASHALSGAGHQSYASLEIEDVNAHVFTSKDLSSRRVLPSYPIARSPLATFPRRPRPARSVRWQAKAAYSAIARSSILLIARSVGGAGLRN